MAGFWKTCLRVLANYLATAHRPTVPPSGERTVIVAIAVALADHFIVRGAPAQTRRQVKR